MRMPRWLIALGSTCVALALVAETLGFMRPTLLPPISALLPKPEGFPNDARIAASDFKDGTRWRYCRPTPSGAVWVDGRADMGKNPRISVGFGKSCGYFPEWRRSARQWDDLNGSLDLPAFFVADGGMISVALPPEALREGVCPGEFSSAFYQRAKQILSEAKKLPDPFLQPHAERFALAMEVIDLPFVQRGPGTSGGTRFCHVAKLRPQGGSLR